MTALPTAIYRTTCSETHHIPPAMSTSWKEKLGFKPAVVEPPAKLTPEEEKAERKRERKERMANAKKEQDKKDKKLQKRIDHAK